ncbi:MAG: 50S ribosomal protein L32 [Phycisphaerales bacterium]|nr:50S ribosomal protein L32 [Phycisphaerales bacterium]
MNPTHRQSPGRTRRRRAHEALDVKLQTLCPDTGKPKQHHRACKYSGYVRPGLTIKVPKLGIGVSKD